MFVFQMPSTGSVAVELHRLRYAVCRSAGSSAKARCREAILATASACETVKRGGSWKSGVPAGMKQVAKTDWPLCGTSRITKRGSGSGISILVFDVAKTAGEGERNSAGMLAIILKKKQKNETDPCLSILSESGNGKGRWLSDSAIGKATGRYSGQSTPYF